MWQYSTLYCTLQFTYTIAHLYGTVRSIVPGRKPYTIGILMVAEKSATNDVKFFFYSSCPSLVDQFTLRHFMLPFEDFWKTLENENLEVNLLNNKVDIR